MTAPSAARVSTFVVPAMGWVFRTRSLVPRALNVRQAPSQVAQLVKGTELQIRRLSANYLKLHGFDRCVEIWHNNTCFSLAGVLGVCQGSWGELQLRLWRLVA